jgi:hypothetical protein
MKKIILALTAVFGVSMIMACTTTTFTMPVDATSNTIGSKVGEVSQSIRIIGVFPIKKVWDVPAYKAAQNGGITKIATIDTRVTTKKGFIGSTVTRTTIVTGEGPAAGESTPVDGE